MKILLVRPPASVETIGLQHVMICEPLELEYLAAAVAEHQVEIVDLILETRPLLSFLESLRPDLVAFTGYISHVTIIKELARQVKAFSTAVVTVVGGVHAEVVPEDFEDHHIDFIVCANGLETFRDLVRSVEMKTAMATNTGIWRPGQPRPVKRRSPVTIQPARQKTVRYRHRYYYLFHNPCALIKTSYGCPFHCNFCFCREITDHHYFTRDLVDVMAEIETIDEPEIYIVDDNFLVSRDRVLAFCDELDRRGINKRFLIYGRADFIAANEDVIERFAKCGLRAVIVGLESCREDELEQFNKRSDLRMNEAAVAILARCKVDCYATLILGIDWHREDFRKLGRWLRKMGLVFINLQPFTPLKGTEMGDNYPYDLRTSRSQFEKWDLAHLVVQPVNMSVAAFYWQIIKLYYSVTFRPAATWSLIRRFGLYENLRLFAGSSRVTRQYLQKVWRNLGWKGRRC